MLNACVLRVPAYILDVAVGLRVGAPCPGVLIRVTGCCSCTVFSCSPGTFGEVPIDPAMRLSTRPTHVFVGALVTRAATTLVVEPARARHFGGTLFVQRLPLIGWHSRGLVIHALGVLPCGVLGAILLLLVLALLLRLLSPGSAAALWWAR